MDRDPATIERTVGISPKDIDTVDDLLEAGASHVILMHGHPFDAAPVERLLEMAQN